MWRGEQKHLCTSLLGREARKVGVGPRNCVSADRIKENETKSMRYHVV
jgi:hypothetical protein